MAMNKPCFTVSLIAASICDAWVSPYSSAARQRRSVFLSNHDENDEPLLASVLVPSTSVGHEWEQATTTIPIAARETLRWCTNVVMKLNLCPWAAASLQTRAAVNVYCVDSESHMNQAVRHAARLFRERKSVDPKVAIGFVVCEEKNWEFNDFYEWSCSLEEEYWSEDEQQELTIAAFHPDWMFAGGEEAVSYEKKSPYPTITIVWTHVIEAAGEEATRKIASQNEKTLLSEGLDALQALYKQDVYLQ